MASGDGRPLTLAAVLPVPPPVLKWSTARNGCSARTRYGRRTPLLASGRTGVGSRGCESAEIAGVAIGRVHPLVRDQLQLRPIRAHNAHRATPNVFPRRPASCLDCNLRQTRAPIPFEHDDSARSPSPRSLPMRDVVVSGASRNKAIHNSARSGHPARGLRTLLAHLATLTRDGATVSDGGNKLFTHGPQCRP